MADSRQKATDAKILDTFREYDDPVLTTSELADALPIGQRAVYNRLQSLAEENQIEKKKVGARGIIWWPSDLEYTYQSAGQQTLTVDDPKLLADLDEDDENYMTKREAVLESFEYLRQHGEVSRVEFYDEVYPSYPAGYGNRRAWWEKVIRPNLTNASAVVDASRGGSWQYKKD